MLDQLLLSTLRQQYCQFNTNVGPTKCTNYPIFKVSYRFLLSPKYYMYKVLQFCFALYQNFKWLRLHEQIQQETNETTTKLKICLNSTVSTKGIIINWWGFLKLKLLSWHLLCHKCDWLIDYIVLHPTHEYTDGSILYGQQCRPFSSLGGIFIRALDIRPKDWPESRFVEWSKDIFGFLRVYMTVIRLIYFRLVCTYTPCFAQYCAQHVLDFFFSRNN